MIFNKNKKKQELEKQIAMENQRAEEERQRKEAQLLKNTEPVKHREEEPKPEPKHNPYTFSEPNPKPKELISVLKEMFKKLFPDARKAYLLLAKYEKKEGYLLVVDIDPKFLKIINIYLDGETKMVRNGRPIECVLYSKSGSLTDGIEPFYVRVVPEVTIPDALKNGVDELNKSSASGELDFSQMSLFGLSSIMQNMDEDAELNLEEIKKAVSTEDINIEEKHEESEPKFEINQEPVKVVPETRQQLFALMNRVGNSKSEEAITIASAGFGEYKFYIPYTVEDRDIKADIDNIGTAFPKDEKCKIVMLINRESGIKAVPFFTEAEEAVAFASNNECGILKMKYRDYKKALTKANVRVPAAEGIIINPFSQQVVLPPDYPLL